MTSFFKNVSLIFQIAFILPSLITTSAAAREVIDFSFLSTEISRAFRVSSDFQFDRLASFEIAAGGFYVGNGGDVAICTNGKRLTYRLLDLVEAENHLHFSADQYDGRDPYELAAEKLQQLVDIAPHRLQRYLEKLRELEFAIKMIGEEESIADLPDSSVSVLPQGCSIEQLAIQLREPDVDGKRLYIAEKYWSRMRVLSKSALLVHEILAEDFFQSGHRDTFYARKLVAALFSDEFPVFLDQVVNVFSLDLREVVGLFFFHQFRLQNHEFKGVGLRTASDTFSSSSETLKVTLARPFQFVVDGRLNFSFFSTEVQEIDFQGFFSQLSGREDQVTSRLTIELNPQTAFVLQPRLIRFVQSSHGTEIETVVLTRRGTSELVSPSPLSDPSHEIFETRFLVRTTTTGTVEFEGLKPKIIPVERVSGSTYIDGNLPLDLVLTSDRDTYRLCGRTGGRESSCRRIEQEIGVYSW